jgi:bifunctional enzyme CysN/CysC
MLEEVQALRQEAHQEQARKEHLERSQNAAELASLADTSAPRQKDLLCFLTCGSVDDGKSTLIGRLLYDTQLLMADQLAELEQVSRRHGTNGKSIDFALLVDGLEAEREQKITIDVAYRFFSTDKRKFIVADTPGHEQYTRNMATGASNADLAVVLIDARKGVLNQTRRHSFIVSLLGIRHVVLAVNKMDLVGYSQEIFDRIVEEYRAFSAELGFETLMPIPMSARFGENVAAQGEAMHWYRGPALIEHLESAEASCDPTLRPFRMPVQWVNRPNMDFRGFSGTIASGSVKPGDPIVVAGSGRISTVTAIVTADGELPRAVAGEAVTLTLADEIDVSRGDVLATADNRPEVSDQFSAHLIWMSDEPLIPSRVYLIKTGARTVGASVTDIKHKIDVDSFSKLAAKTLALNEIGLVNLAIQAPIAFEPYNLSRVGGAFIVIDRITNQTVGAGIIEHSLTRAANIHWQALEVSKTQRARMKSQKPALLWFTGLSGAGKSTIANLVERRLAALGHHTYMLDGDNLRHGLNKDLGFTDADRVENVRRTGEAAKLMVDAGLIVIACLISPFRAERRAVRDSLEPGEFVEVHVSTPLAIAEARDPKGLYKRARQGLITNFTGITSPYEEPQKPEVELDTSTQSAEACAEALISFLQTGGYLQEQVVTHQ